MPAINMAGPLVVAANPSLGKFVMMDAFSGPKNSPLDAERFNPTTFAREADLTNYSTGALSTGIGMGCNHVLNVAAGTSPATPPQAIKNAGFTDDYTPGITRPNGVAATTAILTAIGGGRSIITPGPGNTGLGVSTVSPYTAVPLVGFGNGGSRDAGAGPVFTGFPTKMVTATGAVAIGADIEAGWANRSDFAMVATESAFGSGSTPSVTPTEFVEEEPEEEEEP